MRITANTPELTTATACSSAVTGVGATEAVGSHSCSGNTAALAPNPKNPKTNASCIIPGSYAPPILPPYSKVPVVPCSVVRTTVIRPSAAPPIVYAEYNRPAYMLSWFP